MRNKQNTSSPPLPLSACLLNFKGGFPPTNRSPSTARTGWRAPRSWCCLLAAVPYGHSCKLSSCWRRFTHETSSKKPCILMFPTFWAVMRMPCLLKWDWMPPFSRAFGNRSLCPRAVVLETAEMDFGKFWARAISTNPRASLNPEMKKIRAVAAGSRTNKAVFSSGSPMLHVCFF